MRNIEDWVDLFDESNKERLPLLRMELTFDDQKMQFYPTQEDLEETVLFVISVITKSLQQVRALIVRKHYFDSIKKL